MKTTVHLFFWGVLFLASCSSAKYANFEITNLNETPLENVRIESFVHKSDKIVNVQPNETVKYRIDMSKLPKEDGGYVLYYTVDGRERDQQIGKYKKGRQNGKCKQVKIDGNFTRLHTVF